MNDAWQFLATYSGTILFVCGGIAGTAAFLQNLLTIRKLKYELQKAGLEKEKIEIDLSTRREEVAEKKRLLDSQPLMM